MTTLGEPGGLARERSLYMTENEIATQVVDAAYKIHTRFGPGLLEFAYEKMLEYELKKRGLPVVCQKPAPIVYEDVTLEAGYRIDVMVADKVILELKAIAQTAPVHKKQVLTYLRLADKRLGLLLNFGEALIKTGITRIANNLEDGSSRQKSGTKRKENLQELYALAVWRDLSSKEDKIARQIVEAAYKIHSMFGPGLLASAYETMLAYELKNRGLQLACQQTIPIVYEEISIEMGCRADVIVENKVIVRLQSVERSIPLYKKQVLTQLKSADKRLGLLINFGKLFIKDGISRVVNDLVEE